MPFTPAHPAAVLPLRGRLGEMEAFSALVVGSMMPDLPYFVGLDWVRSDTHSLASVLWFAMPAGLVVWLLFQHLAKAPARALLPRALRRRLDPEPTALRPLAVMVSLGIGALTHLAWDAITHETGSAVQGLPVLHALGLDGPAITRWSYRLLQHGSSIGGLAILALWTRHWMRRTPPRPRRPEGVAEAWRRPLRIALLCGAPACGLLVAFVLLPPPPAEATMVLVARAAVGTLSSGALLLLAVGLLLRLRGAFASARSAG